MCLKRPVSAIFAVFAACLAAGCKPGAGETSPAAPADASKRQGVESSAASTPADPTTPAPPSPDTPPAAPVAPTTAEASRPTGPRLVMPPGFREAAALLAAAKKARREQQFDDALERLDRVLEIYPDHVEASLLKAATLRVTGRAGDALATLNDALATRPGTASLIREKALCQIAGGEPREAVRTLDALHEAGDATFPESHYLKGVALTALGETEKAAAALRDAIQHGFVDTSRMREDPALEPLRKESVFGVLLHEMAVKRHAMREAARLQQLSQKTYYDELPEAKATLSGRELLSDLEQRLRLGTGKPISFRVTTLDGKAVTAAECAGKPLLLLLWGSWSLESRKFLPEIQRVEDFFKDRQLRVLTLAYEVDSEHEVALQNAARVMRENFVKLECAVISARLADSLGVSRFPTSLLVHADGKEYLRFRGSYGADVLKRLVSVLIAAEPPAAPLIEQQR